MARPKKMTLTFENQRLEDTSTQVVKEVIYYDKTGLSTNKVKIGVIPPAGSSSYTISTGVTFAFTGTLLEALELSEVKSLDENWECITDSQLNLKYKGTADQEWSASKPLSILLSLPVKKRINEPLDSGSLSLSKVQDATGKWISGITEKNLPTACNIEYHVLSETPNLNLYFKPGPDGRDGSLVFISGDENNEIQNTLEFCLENRGKNALMGGSLSIKIAAGDEYYDLAPYHQLNGLLPEIIRSNSPLEPFPKTEYNKDLGFVYWTTSPTGGKSGVLLGKGPENTLTFRIKDIVTYLKEEAAAELRISLKDSDDNIFHSVFLKIQKILPEPRIYKFSCLNENDTVHPDDPIRLSWSCIEVTNVRLSCTLNSGKVIDIPDLPLHTGESGYELKRTDHPELPVGEDIELHLYAKPKAPENNSSSNDELEAEENVKILDYVPLIIVRECKFIDENKNLQVDYEFNHCDDSRIESNLFLGGAYKVPLNKYEGTLDTIEANISSWGGQVFTFKAKNDRGVVEIKRTAVLQPVIRDFNIEYNKDNELTISLKAQYCDYGVDFEFTIDGTQYQIWNVFSWAAKGGQPNGKPRDIRTATFTYHVEEQEEFKKAWAAANAKITEGRILSLELENLTLIPFNHPHPGEKPGAEFSKLTHAGLEIYFTPELEILDFGVIQTVSTVQYINFFFKPYATALNFTSIEKGYKGFTEAAINEFSYTGPTLKSTNFEWLGLVNSSEGADVQIKIKAENFIPEIKKILYFKEAKTGNHGGNEGGHYFAPTVVKSICINGSDIVYALFMNKTWNGERKGKDSRTLELGQGEYIKEVVVFDAWISGHLVVTYLKITTNKNNTIEGGNRDSGANQKGKTFTGKILAIGGKCGGCLDRVDVVYLKD